MKCIQFTDGKIVRVADFKAESFVKKGEASYVSNSVWKEKVRDKDKKEKVRDKDKKEK